MRVWDRIGQRLERRREEKEARRRAEARVREAFMGARSGRLWPGLMEVLEEAREGVVGELALVPDGNVNRMVHLGGKLRMVEEIAEVLEVEADRSEEEGAEGGEGEA